MSIYNPRQTILVSCRGPAKHRFTLKEEIKDNLITLDWHMPASFDPFPYAIAAGKTRFSCSIIRNSGVFVVNFMPFEYKKGERWQLG